MSDEKTIECARQWIDQLDSGLGVNGSWRLQRLDKRVRVKPGDEDSSPVTVDELPTRIRRFTKGIPWALVIEAVRYLHSKAPYSGIIFNGVPCDKTYYPTRTWWERDEGAVVDRGQQNEGTYTLYQDLVDRDTLDSLDFDAGGSCSEKVTMSYVYDAADIPDVPPGGIGETVSVQAVSRNEDGTVQYAIVRRKALTQPSPASIVKDDEFERVTVQTWDNVYPLDGGYVDQDGNPVVPPIPSPSESTDGVNVELTVQENADCTLKIVAQTTEAKKVKSERTTTATVFEKSARDVTRADAPSGPDVTSASGGRIKSHKWEKRPDGKFDLTDESRVETSVDDAVWEKRRTLRSVKVSKTDRNQGPAAEAAARTFVTRVGQSVRIAKTDGGLVDITYESVASESVGDIREECRKTTFEHIHSVTRNQKEDPAIDAPSAGGGVVRTVSKSATEDGTFDVTSESRIEQPVESAVWEKRRTLRSVRVSRTDRNQDSVAEAAARGFVSKVGQSVRIERTDGGLANITYESVASESVGDIREECRKTLFDHVHSKTRNQKADPGNVDVASASGGKVRTVSKVVTDDGTFDITSESREELSVPSSVWEKRRTLRSVRVTRTDRNQGSDAEAAARAFVTKVGQSVRIEKTDGGLANITYESVLSESAGEVREECQRTVFVHRHSVTNNRKDKPSNTDAGSSGGGKTRTVTVARTEDGTYDVTSESQEEQPVPKSQRSIQRTPFRTVVVFKDTTASTRADASDSIEGVCSPLGYQQSGAVPTKNGSASRKIQQEFEVSQGGMATQTKTFSFANPVSWTLPAVSTNYKYHKTWKFRNFDRTQLNRLLTGSDDGNGTGGVYGWFNSKVNAWVNENRPPSSHDVDCDATLNDDGFFDGQVTADARWSIGTAGQTGPVGAIISSIEWSYYHFDPGADKNYTIGPTSTWDGTWSACKYRMVRIIGRGKALLDKFTKHTACMRAPNVSYNPESGMWTLEVQSGFEGIYTVTPVTFGRYTWLREIESASNMDAPSGAPVPMPSTSDTEFK